MSFYDDRIHIWKQTIEYLEKPHYLKLYVNEKNKWLFLQISEKRDCNTFKVYYTKDKDLMVRCHIMAKKLMKYFASAIGVPYPSDSLKFIGRYMEEENALFFNLTEYEVIPYTGPSKKEEENEPAGDDEGSRQGTIQQGT